ncbi:helix-turn-helix domain-containing protein [Streptosporangium sp. NPDC087985]|uniref:helix-turn-helix domain-containing protein n=1 Tax=Streptosporangium sp. NPDC087985 TaxID=3366196 RepID=UPI0037FC3A30
MMLREKLMTVQDVADCLGIPKSRIYDNWKMWGLPFFRVGQQLRCDPADFRKWIEKQKAA